MSHEPEPTIATLAPIQRSAFGVGGAKAEPALTDGWAEERLIDEDGEIILIHYKGRPSQERYEYIRDYLDFKVKRMGSAKKPD